MPTALTDSARTERSAAPPRIDLVIPVYNEGANILSTLGALARDVRTPLRVLICYDRDDDDTLPAVRNRPDVHAGLDVVFIRNRGRGAHGAVMAGFAASRAEIVVASWHPGAGLWKPWTWLNLQPGRFFKQVR